MSAITIVEPNSQTVVNTKRNNNLLSETKKLLEGNELATATTNCLKTTTTATLAILKNSCASKGLSCDANGCNCMTNRNYIHQQALNSCNHRCNHNNNGCLKKPFIADLALMDTDYLIKTPSLTVPDLLRTPTIGSPIKFASSSSCLHVDDLNTPSMGSSTPKNHGQAFFGEHEPLLTGIKVLINIS